MVMSVLGLSGMLDFFAVVLFVPGRLVVRRLASLLGDGGGGFVVSKVGAARYAPWV